MKRVAIIHDCISEYGGAERVLQYLIEIFPTADIYSPIVKEEIYQKYFPNKHKRKLYTFWFSSDFFSHHTSLFQAISPFFWKAYQLGEYDLVIANSSYLMANLVNPKQTTFVQIIQTHPKNIFDKDQYTLLQRIVPYHYYLAPYYKNIINQGNIIVNSFHMQKVIQTLFATKSQVIYPPVTIPKTISIKKTGKYFLSVGRIDRSKSIEIAIQACNTLHERLLIIGKTNEPEYETYLRSIAGPTVQFLGFLSDNQIYNFYIHAKALLFTAKNEDFGITPVEAMSHGVPVIAYYGGGVKETILAYETGLFFHQHNSHALVRAMKQFNGYEFNSKKIWKYTQRYSSNRFKNEFMNYINHLAKDYSENISVTTG